MKDNDIDMIFCDTAITNQSNPVITDQPFSQPPPRQPPFVPLRIEFIERLANWHGDYVEAIGSSNICNINGLNNAFAFVENKNTTVNSIILSVFDYAQLRSFGRTIYDEASVREVALTGVFGFLWTANIYVRSFVPLGRFYLADGNNVTYGFQFAKAEETPEDLKLKTTISVIQGLINGLVDNHIATREKVKSLVNYS